MTLLNVVWPALYIYTEIWHFAFLIFLTIAVETVTIAIILKYSLEKSFFASLIGNLISGFIGSFVMVWVMLFWHATVDRFMAYGTFDIINWVATFIIMCLGSVFIETLAISLIFKDKIKRLFIPLLIGNLLSYSLIAYSMANRTDKDPNEERVEQVLYSPIPSNFILLDSTKLKIDTAKTEISYGKNDKILNSRYELEIPFKKEQPERFQFNLRLLGSEHSGGIERERKQIKVDTLTDTIQFVLEQRSIDPEVGWLSPIVTDTIKFVKLLPTNR